MSLGLEQEGWHVIGAIDNDRHALDTYSFNRPSILEPKASRPGYTSVFNRDLHDKNEFADVVGRLRDSLSGAELDLLVGGPPCQGFSHAGFRLKDDKRNDLASMYLHFAEELRPRMFLLENVEGLTTFKKGQVLKDICQALKDLGYRVCDPVWKLCAEQYGVPQMRRRVFVVATTDPEIDISPPDPTHLKCEGRRAPKPIEDLFENELPLPNSVADALAGLSLPPQDAQSDLSDWLAARS